MPRGDQLTSEQVTGKYLILGDPKAGKTTWAIEAALSGFNVLLMDGDVAVQVINQLPASAKHRIYYMDVSDRLEGGIEPRMIQVVSDFFTSTVFVWNDSKQRVFSARLDIEDGIVQDEIWEIRPARLDWRWVIIVDSWTTLSYSAMLAKAADVGVDLGDIEKADMNLYAGAGNRLTNMLATIQKAKCHFVVIGHPSQFEKTRSPDNTPVKEVKAKDRIVEWTKMVPKSSSNPHGLTMGKFFSDIGWIEVDKWGKRKLNFQSTNERVSGGHLTGKGDPKADFSFASCVKNIGGTIPDLNDFSTGAGFIVHLPGTYQPATGTKNILGAAAKPATLLSTASAEPKPMTVKGLGGLAGLKKPA